MPMVYSNNGHSFGNKNDDYVLQAGEAILPEGATPTQILAAFPRFNDKVPATSVLPQDLIAQFTADDVAKIQTVISGNTQFWLLWSAMLAQKDPMIVTSTRFQAGWAALVQVLGQPRMTAIAAAVL